MYYSETLGKTITNEVYRIIKMRSRGTYHIYGLDKKEYNEKMKDAGFLIKEADTLLKDFKTGLLTEFILILRRVDFSLSLCCQNNTSQENILGRIQKDLVYCKVSGTFKDTLDEWVKIITEAAWNKYTNECSLLPGGADQWEAIKCPHMESNGFINGIKINSKGELEKPISYDKKDCEKEAKSFKDKKYDDWGVGEGNKWSSYEKPVINGVLTYVN